MVLVTSPAPASRAIAPASSTTRSSSCTTSFALFAIRLLDGLLDLGDGLIARQYAGDGEEAGLHDGVDARAHAVARATLEALMT
jgi:hypothetical protein